MTKRPRDQNDAKPPSYAMIYSTLSDGVAESLPPVFINISNLEKGKNSEGEQPSASALLKRLIKNEMRSAAKKSGNSPLPLVLISGEEMEDQFGEMEDVEDPGEASQQMSDFMGEILLREPDQSCRSKMARNRMPAGAALACMVEFREC